MNGRILVIEDDTDVRESLTEGLGLLGYDVTAAENGSDAFDKLAKMKTRPCLILLDLMMPVMNGWEFRQKQAADPKYSSIPVVVVTADRSAKAKAQAVGADHWVSKPLDLDSLHKVVQVHCR